MIKLLVLIFIFVSGCSKNSEKSLFKSEILDKEKKPVIEKSLFKKELLLNKNFNENLKINLPNQISQVSNSYLKNNQGRNKFDIDKEKIKKYKFKKIKNFNQYETNIVFDDTGVIFFDGSGSAGQNNSLKGELSVTVTKVFDNGNMEILGQKKLTLNNGDEYIRLLGVIRPEDINNQNTVQSSRIANAKISYTGAGDIADPSKKGWFSKLIDAVQPL